MPESGAKTAVDQAIRVLLRDIDNHVDWPLFEVTAHSPIADPRRIEDPATNAVWNLADLVADAVGHGFTTIDHGVPLSEGIAILRQIVDEPTWRLENMDPRVAKFQWPKARRRAGNG